MGGRGGGGWGAHLRWQCAICLEYFVSKLHTSSNLSDTGSGVPLAALWSLTDVYADVNSFSHTHKPLLLAFILFLAGWRTHQNPITSFGRSSMMLKQTDFGDRDCFLIFSQKVNIKCEETNKIGNAYLVFWDGLEQLRHGHVCTHNPE